MCPGGGGGGGVVQGIGGILSYIWNDDILLEANFF